MELLFTLLTPLKQIAGFLLFCAWSMVIMALIGVVYNFFIFKDHS